MWPYWLTLIAYLLASAGTPVAARSWPRWAGITALTGLVLLGLVLLLPTTCRSLPMRMCDPQGTCDPSGDTCSTPAGLPVPYADALGVPATQALGAALIVAGLFLALLTRRATTTRRRHRP